MGKRPVDCRVIEGDDTFSKLKSTDIVLNNQKDALTIQIYCHKTPHVSGIFSAHHQELSTVPSALVSFMQVFDDHFQAESGWNSIMTLLESGHQTNMKRTSAECTVDNV